MRATRRICQLSFVCLMAAGRVVTIAQIPEPAPASTASEWMLPDSAYGTRTAPLLLLSRPEVRNELAMDATQVMEVQSAIADLRGRAASLRGPDTPQTIEARKQLDSAQKRWLEKHLTPNQKMRLGQIDLQWEGSAALVNRPVLIESLGLTGEQTQNLKQGLADRNRYQSGDEKTRNDAEQRFEKLVMRTLSDSQAKRWRAYLGSPLAIKVASSNRSTNPGR